MRGAVGKAALPFAVWYDAERRRGNRDEALRWGLSFLAVLAVAGGGFWWGSRLPASVPPAPEPQPAAIAIDLAPEPAATPNPPTDAAPGPRQTLSQPDPQPDPPPKITAPPSPAPNPPVPVPKPEKPRPLKKVKITSRPARPLPDRTPPAPATTAPPSSDAPRATADAAPAPGASSAHASQSPATWQGSLLARLEQFKRYPADAQTGREEGTAMVTFSMDRKGHVLAAHLAGGSGHASLDAETLALVRRAEPLPPPPDEVRGDPITLTVPVEFYLSQLRN